MPTDLDQKPTEEAIRELHNYVWNEAYWSQQHTLDTKLKALSREEHKVEVSDFASKERKNRLELERMTLAEGPRTIRVISSLFSAPPNIGVMWIGEGSRATGKVDLVEIGLAELSDQLNPPTDAPWDRAKDQLLDLGRMATLTLPGDAYWWDTPKIQPGETNSAWLARYKDWQRKAPVPILYRDLPAETTFPSTLGNLNDLALCTLKTTWYELQDIFNEKELGPIIPEQKERFAPITLGIYANRRHIAYIVFADEKSGFVGRRGFKDTIIRNIEHDLGKCPIRILPGRTGPKEPGQYWRSVLHEVMDMIPQLDRRISEAATASHATVLPWLKAHLNRRDGEDGSARITRLLQGDLVELDPGDPTAGTPREELDVVHIPPFGQENMELASLLRDTIRDVTGAVPALTGNIDIGSGPAWSLNWTGEMAKAGQGDITAAVIAARIDHFEMLIRCVEAFGETIVLQRHDEDASSITLEPDDLGKWEPILKGDYKPRVPINEIAMIQTAVSVMQAIAPGQPLPLDQFYIMEKYLDIKQPHEHWKQSLKTRLITSPEVEKWYAKHMLEEAEIELAGDEGMGIAEFEEMAARGELPPEMVDVIRQKVGGREAQSAGIRGAPFSRSPGGPTPQEVVP